MPYLDPAWALAGILKTWGIAAAVCALAGLVGRALWAVLHPRERIRS